MQTGALRRHGGRFELFCSAIGSIVLGKDLYRLMDSAVLSKTRM